MSPETLNQRKPVWLLLSELYLDIELEPADFVRIAAGLRNAGLNWEEVLRINTDEVAPVLIQNLFSVAGAWIGFSEEPLYSTIMARELRPGKVLGSGRLWSGFVKWMLKDCLPQLKHHFYLSK